MECEGPEWKKWRQRAASARSELQGHDSQPLASLRGRQRYQKRRDEKQTARLHSYASLHPHRPAKSTGNTSKRLACRIPTANLNESLNASNSSSKNEGCAALSAGKSASLSTTGVLTLTVNVTLSLVGLRHEQVRHMPSDVVLIAHGIATKDFLQSAAQSVSM